MKNDNSYIYKFKKQHNKINSFYTLYSILYLCCNDECRKLVIGKGLAMLFTNEVADLFETDSSLDFTDN